MPRVRIDNVGSVGFVKDAFAQETPPEAWTTVQNARMSKLGAEKFLGHALALGTGTAGFNANPYWMFYIAVAGGAFFVAACATKVLCRLAASPYTETDISRAVGGAYTGTEDQKWNGGQYGGIAVFNNGADVPQVWNTPAAGTKLVGLDSFASGGDAWPSNYRCAVMRPFGRFLVALDITKNTTRYPQMVKWGDPADAGSMPASWDPANTAKLAGEYSLADGSGNAIDCLPLRNQNMIYLQNEVWSQTLSGTNNIFRWDRQIKTQGTLARNCMALFKARGIEMHAVLGTDDLFVHNGQSATSIADEKVRRWFFQQLDPTNYGRSFVVNNPIYNEVWFCIPEIGQSEPTLAMVWNYNDDTIGFRDLLKATSNGDTRTTAATQGSQCIMPGFITDLNAETWASDSASWDSDTTIWDALNANPATPRLLMLDKSAGNRAFLLDSTGQFDATNPTVTLERIGLAIAGQDRQGQPKADQQMVKLITEVWPKFEAPAGTVFSIQVGAQMEENDGVTWSAAVNYTVGTDQKVDCYLSGRFLAIRITVTSSAVWRLLNYELTVEPIGVY